MINARILTLAAAALAIALSAGTAEAGKNNRNGMKKNEKRWAEARADKAGYEKPAFLVKFFGGLDSVMTATTTKDRTE